MRQPLVSVTYPHIGAVESRYVNWKSARTALGYGRWDLQSPCSSKVPQYSGYRGKSASQTLLCTATSGYATLTDRVVLAGGERLKAERRPIPAVASNIL
jgi:hypothetical protein